MSILKKMAMVAAMVLGVSGAAHASSYTYQFSTSLTCSSCTGGTMDATGTITVNQLGALTASNVTGFNVTLIANGTDYTISNSSGLFELHGDAAMTATAGQLSIALTASNDKFSFDNELGGNSFTYNFVGETGVVNVNGTNFLGVKEIAGPSTFTANVFSAPPAATPEPSSLVLLGTGGLSMAALLRRKLKRS